MSGICGIASIDGPPVGLEELQAMSRAASHRGQDGITFWRQGPVGMAHLSTIITPQSRLENQPVEAGHLVLTADCRIDNRSELKQLLDLNAEDPTDAGLILAAYRRWGAECPGYIIGDFAFALWDGQACHLLLARDPMAMRALYYRVDAKRLYFATEIKQILALPEVPAQLNEPALAAFLADCDMPRHWTYYQGINQLQAGHVLIFKSGRPRLHRFWDIDPQEKIRYKDETQYIEHFRELFLEAVGCRLRSISPVGLMLSGGMDSMSIAAAAGWMMQKQTSSSWPLFLTFSSAFDAHPECDERSISSILAEYFGFPAIDVPTDQTWPLSGFPALGPDRDDPETGHYQELIVLGLQLARQRNVRLLLSGDRGDLLLTGVHYDYAGNMLRGNWQGLAKELRAESEISGISLPRAALAGLMSSTLPRLWPGYRLPRLRGFARSLLKGNAGQNNIFPPWLNKKFARSSRLPKVIRQSARQHSPISEYGRRQRYQAIFDPLRMRLMVWMERVHAGWGTGFADPWSDRRLARFALAIPHEVINRPREYKYLAREAMQGIMPQAALKKVGKILPTAYFLSAMRNQSRTTVLELIENSAAHDFGFIDKTILRKHYEEVLAGGSEPHGFWCALCTEMWLRRFWT